jgi:hypothetical protein
MEKTGFGQAVSLKSDIPGLVLLDTGSWITNHGKS